MTNSFDVTATLSFTSDPPYGIAFPESERFTLGLADAPDATVVAIFGNDKGVDEGVFDRADADVSLREPVDLRVVFGDYDAFGSRPYMTFESLHLVLQDGDGDGDADTMTGDGSGVLSYVLGDVPYDSTFTVQIRGDADTTPPELRIVGSGTGLHVLDGLRITASEPLLPGSTARAWLGDTPIDLTAFPVDGAYVRTFASSAVLPFDTELPIEIAPEPRDLAGLAAVVVPSTVRTMPDPGLFAEDGFESDPVAAIGGATAVTGVGDLPAIAGARSLLVEPGAELTMRIPLTGSETHLRFRARLLFEQSYGCSTHEMRVGVHG